MENRFVSCFRLTVGLRVGDGGEPGLAPQGAEIVGELSDVKLPAVIEDDGVGNAKANDDVLPYEPSYFSCGYGHDGFGLYPLGEVVDRHKEVFALPCCFRERFKDVHALSSE